MISKFYVFDVITPFHLISSLAFCLSKGKEGDLISVNIIPSMKGDLLLEEASFITDNGISVIIKKQERCAGVKDFFSFFLHRYLWIGTVAEDHIYIGHHTYFKPSSLFFLKEKYKGKILKTFSFEEGIGSYASLKQEKEVALREGKKLYAIKFLLKKALSSKAILNYRWGLFSTPNNVLIKKYYQKAANLIALNLYPLFHEAIECNAKNNKVNGKKRALFFSTPFVRLGLLSEEENKNFVSDIQQYFIKREITLFVKPHPLDSECYSDIVGEENVVKDDAPAEVHLINNRYECVSGVNSGALLTASVMYGIKAINFYNKLPESAKSKLALGKNLKKLFSDFTVNCKV